MEKKVIKLSESQLSKLINESIKTILDEGRITDTDGSLAKMDIASALESLGVRRIDSYDAKDLLNPRGAQVVSGGGYIFNWVIELDDGEGDCFFSQHNFPSERAAEKNCNKYINYLRKRGCMLDAYIYSIWLANEEDARILGGNVGDPTMDCMLAWHEDTGWMD